MQPEGSFLCAEEHDTGLSRDIHQSISSYSMLHQCMPLLQTFQLNFVCISRLSYASTCPVHFILLNS
jgi:hypothetical protein